MAITIRDIKEEDIEKVHRINQRNIPNVSDITMEDLKWLCQRACFKKLVEDKEGIFGFILCFFPGHPYESPNYQWFVKNYDNFLYIDRIAIDERGQGKGIGSLLYGELEGFGTDSNSECLCCEVNIRPTNELSMRFHEKHKFEKVGEQDTETGKKTVALLTKRLNHTEQSHSGDRVYAAPDA